MASIQDLGIGTGFIYVVDTEDTSIIHYNIPNTEDGARQAKIKGIQSSNIASNIRAVGTITISTITGSGNVTDVTINAVSQIKTVVPYTIATSTSALAALVAAQINTDVPGSGADYTALSIGNIIYLMAPASSGDTVNGSAVTITFSANATGSTTDVIGGSDANDYPYDNRSGYRFFIDPTSDAVAGTVGVAAVEITGYICQRGLETGIPIQTATISSGAITVTREAAIMYIALRGEGSVADTLTTINPVGFADGDMLMLLGVDAAVAITIDNTGNITTQNATSFVTGDKSNVITVGLNGTEWYEINKSTTAVPSAAQFRTASFPFLSTSGYGSAALTAADNTTVTLTANSSKQKQVITGTVSLTTGNYTIAIPTTDAVAGDIFDIEYNGVVTVGSYAVVIGGITLSAADALTGGIVVRAYYSGSAWQYECFKDFNQAAKVQTTDYATASITVPKLETNLQYEMIVIPVSFNSGETAMNKIKMPYPGSLVGLYAISTSEIADSSTITPKDNAGTVMTDGTITFAAGDNVDTAYISTPSANNTFVADDVLEFLTQTSTLGSGKALLTIKILRS